MTRLWTAGFEWGDSNSDMGNWSGGGTFAVSSSIKHSGAYALDLGPAGGVVTRKATTTLGRTYYLRAWYRVSGYPDVGALVTPLEAYSTAGGISAALVLQSDGTLKCFSGGYARGTASSAIGVDTWACLELSWSIGTGSVDTIAGRLNGVEFNSETGLNLGDTLPDTLYWSQPTNMGSGIHVYVDDIGFNDNQGSTQNSWPGVCDGIALLRPISDNSIGGWTNGAGGTTNLWDALNNLPPTGKQASGATDQIENAVSSATDNYDVNLATYTDGGIPSDKDVLLCHAVAWHGEDSGAGTKNGAIQIVSNPTQASESSFVYGDDQGSLDDWGYLWGLAYTSAESDIHGMSVTRGSSPVLRVGKRTATNSRVAVTALGMYVEYGTASAGHYTITAGVAATVYYAGTTVDASGDSYIVLNETVNQQITLGLIESTPEIYTISFPGLRVFVEVPLIESASAIYSLTAAHSDTVGALDLLTSASALYAPTLGLGNPKLSIYGTNTGTTEANLRSLADTYEEARTGSGATVEVRPGTPTWDTTFPRILSAAQLSMNDPSEWWNFQSFLEFDVAGAGLPSNATVIGVVLELHYYRFAYGNVAYSPQYLEIRELDFGGFPLTSADWTSGADLASLPLVVTSISLAQSQAAATQAPYSMWSSVIDESFIDYDGYVRWMLSGDGQRLDRAIGAHSGYWEQYWVISASWSQYQHGTLAYAPRLVIEYTIPPDQDVDVGLIESSSAIYAPQVLDASLLAQTLEAQLLGEDATLYALSLTYLQIAELTLLGQDATIYELTEVEYLVAQPQLPLIDSGPTMYAPTLLKMTEDDLTRYGGDDGRYRGQSMNIHVINLSSAVSASVTPEMDTTNTNATYDGQSPKVEAVEGSPAQWDSTSITGPALEEGYYRGVSDAIHVFGDDEHIIDPPPPVTCCDDPCGTGTDGITDTFTRSVGPHEWGTSDYGTDWEPYTAWGGYNYVTEQYGDAVYQVDGTRGVLSLEQSGQTNYITMGLPIAHDITLGVGKTASIMFTLDNLGNPDLWDYEQLRIGFEVFSPEGYLYGAYLWIYPSDASLFTLRQFQEWLPDGSNSAKTILGFDAVVPWEPGTFIPWEFFTGGKTFTFSVTRTSDVNIVISISDGAQSFDFTKNFYGINFDIDNIFFGIHRRIVPPYFYVAPDVTWLVHVDNLDIPGVNHCLVCEECEDPDNPGFQLPDFTPGYLPIFRKQIGDPTTRLDSWICTLESGAMVLDWHTRGAVQVWGGELIPWCGRSEEDIYGHGNTLGNVHQAWLHWDQNLSVRSGQTWDDLMACLAEGRAAIIQGDYGVLSDQEKCQDNFDGGHAIVLFPYFTDGRILVGDPLCHDYHGLSAQSLRNYVEAMGEQVYGSHSPQPILFAVSRPWTP